MYLKHFGLKDWPFTLTPNTSFFCNLPVYQEALNTVLFSVRSGEGFVKVIGEVGSGKTLLCRKLLDQLAEEFVTAYIPNPNLSADELRQALAKELGVSVGAISDDQLLTCISEKLIAIRHEGKRTVLVIDEAQALPDDTLEALRLLSNLETESEKLLQIVLFAQPELDAKLEQYRFRPLQQRIGFGYRLQALHPSEVAAYLHHRLEMAGYADGRLLTRGAQSLVCKASQGVPRVINILCHKALLVAYGRGETRVKTHAIKSAIADSADVLQTLKVRAPSGLNWKVMVVGVVILGLAVAAAVVVYTGLT